MMSAVLSTKIVHLHIPKTAGTAFRSAFELAAGGKLRIFTHFDERRHADIDSSQFDFFSGHIGFETAAKIGGEIITVLRNPVDRFVSVYHFWRRLSERGIEKSHRTALAHKFSLSEFVKIRDEPALLEAFYNVMTWQVAHGTSLVRRRELRLMGKTDNDVIELAIANLSTFALVGIQERLQIFEAAMAQRYSLPLKIRKINVAEARPGSRDIDAATLTAIRDWTFMDLKLYEYAEGLVSKSAGDPKPR
jgi:hypothetical protein